MKNKKHKDKRNDNKSAGTIRRQNLFDRFSANLEVFAPEHRGLFGCPLCLTGFTKDETGTNGQLTIEHCVPGALGGKIETLTCKTCNNLHGELFDSQLVKWRQYEDYAAGLSNDPVKTVVTAGDASLPATITRDLSSGSLRISVTSKRSNPKALEKAHSYFKTPRGQEQGFNFVHRTGLKDHEFRVGLLRSAYLTMFHWFGYSYALHTPVGLIRRQIKEYNIISIKNPVVATINDNRLTKDTVCVLKNPARLRCFIVMVRLATQYSTKTYLVILPGFSEDAELIYERLDEAGVDQIITENIFNLRYHSGYLFDPMKFGTAKGIYDAVVQHAEG